MEPSMVLANEVVKQLAKQMSANGMAKLVKQMLKLQEEQLQLLLQVQFQQQLLLMADFNAGRQHLEYVGLKGRDKKLNTADITKARELFVRAIGQTVHGDLQAIIRIHIALCSAMLGDFAVACLESKRAVVLMDQVLKSCNQTLQFYSERERAMTNFANSIPWYSLNNLLGDANPELAEFTKARESLASAVERLELTRQSLIAISEALRRLADGQ